MMRKFLTLTAAVALFLLLTAMKGGGDDTDKDDADKNESSGDKGQVAQDLLTHSNEQNHSTSIQDQLKQQDKSVNESPIPETGIEDNIMLSDDKPNGNGGINFEVIDLSKEDKSKVFKELMTSQAEGKFYYRKVETEGAIEKEKLASAFDEFIEDMNMDSSLQEKWKKKKETLFMKSPMAQGKSDNQPFKYRITSSGKYQYYDGRKIVGSKDLKQSFDDQYKPLAELVFFYEIRDKGYLKKDIGPREFLSMDVSEQRKVIKDVPIIQSSTRK